VRRESDTPPSDSKGIIDVQGPQMIVLVPTMELGVQEALLIYKLFGGSVNPGIPGAKANMFAYTGPRGLKVTSPLHSPPPPAPPPHPNSHHMLVLVWSIKNPLNTKSQFCKPIYKFGIGAMLQVISIQILQHLDRSLVW